MTESSVARATVSFIILEVRAASRRWVATLLSPKAKKEAALLGEAADLLVDGGWWLVAGGWWMGAGGRRQVAAGWMMDDG